MKTAIINGKIITPHRILDQASLVMEDGYSRNCQGKKTGGRLLH